ncbi:conserved hypothetical protein [Chlamydia pneumoniae LPCoLN]|uniref:DUF1539 domain-containing protein n=1 Tax=Chlamydia pneumoniae TaxID=83558 RepID=UPI0001BD9BD7|nr:DUF1539 domain-containing protein [Chlamydia pneumoniae]ACZ32855.1 conserved hypothetical protein [Chlamydia pneumoniae LPCoLN]
MSNPISLFSPAELIAKYNLIPKTSPIYPRRTELIILEENACQTRLTNVAQILHPSSLFSMSKKILNPCGCSGGPLCWVILNILAFIITSVLFIILLPVNLIVAGLRLFMPLPPKKIVEDLSEPTTEETNEVIQPFIFALQALLFEDNKLRSFKIVEQSVSKAPLPNPFLNRLVATSPQESQEAMRKIPDLCSQLKKVLKSLGVLTPEWKHMLKYFEGLKNEHDSNPDKKTFPILIKLLIEALTGKSSFFSNLPKTPSTKEKMQAALFIASSCKTCKPTWGEVITRSLNRLYSIANEGDNQLLIWVQEFKERELMSIQDGDDAEEYRFAAQQHGERYTEAIEQVLRNESAAKLQWHVINTMKFFHGKNLGLVTEHLQDTLGALTLRQTTVDTHQGREDADLSAALFLNKYLNSGNQLVNSVFKSMQKADPETKALIREFALDILYASLRLPQTSAHTEVFSTLLMDPETYEPNKACIAYLLYVLKIIEL